MLKVNLRIRENLEVFMGKTGDSDHFSPKEAADRFVAALRGSRVTGHKQMADIPKKRAVKRAKPKKKPGK